MSEDAQTPLTTELYMELFSKHKQLRDENARLRGALQRIAQYGDKGIHGNDGICPYGCDTPHIAQAALDGGKGVQGG